MNDTSTAQPPRTRTQLAMDGVSRAALGVAATALGGLVVVQGWQVIARYVLNNSPSWTEPLTVLLLSVTVGLGAAAAVHERRHFRFNLLADSLGANARRAVDAVTALVVVVLGVMMAWWGAVLFVDGLHIPAAGARVPQSANYLPLALGGALITLFSVCQFVETIKGRRAA